MLHPLDNPAFNALISGDEHLGSGDERIRLFDPRVSPFAGIRDDHTSGLEEIHQITAPGRRILIAIPHKIMIPKGWKIMAHLNGLQFIYENKEVAMPEFEKVPLKDEHIKEMMELTQLTKPGPFDERTIDFGEYYGIFENDRLASMAGQRLHVFDHSEISAVCTHPDFLGKGYAAKLLTFQLHLITSRGKIPFLHVRADNKRAISLYERTGFKVRSEMNFYFLRRE